ncbi:hypothetical protein KP509_21G067100 [Ceratopteris richardii]|uniref:DUF659 domain-containing protein n=1 Tax=Ceratopteris richardii TaxID=49495 RepID=A0A8T2SEI5_CERRI|nr:hypothetical protein KP509_21G067100 [Ceratopteris richardii]
MCKYCGRTFCTTITRLIRHVSGSGGMGISACPQVPLEIAKVVRNEHNLAQAQIEARRREVAASSLDMLEELDLTIDMSSASQPIDTSGKGRTCSERDIESESSQPARDEPPLQRPRSGSLHSSFLTIGLQKQRQKAAEIEISRCILECNLSFNVVRTDAWKRMVRSIAQVGPCDDWYGVEYHTLRGSMLLEERARIDVLLEPIRIGWKMAIDCSAVGTRITGEYIYEHIKCAIEEVGAENVVQVITDNASNYKRMGELVESEYPSIVWTPCTTHSIDLLFEDIGKLTWVAPILADAKCIISFIRKNHHALSLFRSYSEKELVRISETWFGYIFYVLTRLYDCMDALRMIAIDRRWSSMPRGLTDVAKYTLIPVLKSIHIVLCIVDMEGSTMGLVYHLYMRMRRAIASVTCLSSSRINDVLRAGDSRWDFLSRPIHGFAALLHLYFKSPDLWSEASLRHMKDLYMERIMTPDQQVAFDVDFSAYMGNICIAYARTTSLRADMTSKALEWWNHYGYGHQAMTRHALRVLSQVSPVLFETAFTNGSGDLDSCVHDEQDEFYRLLHSELETFDRRVTRSRSRSLVRGIEMEVVADVPSTSTAPSTWRGQRRKMRPRRRGDPVPPKDDIQDPDELFAGVSVDPSITLVPEFDDEGNVLVMGGILSSEA